MFTNIPSLDLHGETSDTARILIDEFITDNLKLGNYKVLIIHGIGKGILSKKCEYILKNNKKVIEYGKDYFNLGATIAKINVDKK